MLGLETVSTVIRDDGDVVRYQHVNLEGRGLFRNAEKEGVWHHPSVSTEDVFESQMERENF